MYLVPIAIFSIYSVYLNNTIFNYSVIITENYDIQIQETNTDMYNLIKII